MSELDEDERFLVWSLRRFLFGDLGVAYLGYEFERRFGKEDAVEGLSLLSNYLLWSGRSARRTVRHYPICCSWLTGDEVILVRLVAAVQQGRYDLSGALLRWFAKPDKAEALETHARLLSVFLARRGIGLSARPIGGAEPPEAFEQGFDLIAVNQSL
ncbi:MAG: hypothetical protein AAGB03_03670 [Pseudomonadota bacterium]